MSTRKFKRILSLVLSASCVTALFISPNSANAEITDCGSSSINEEVNSIAALKTSALSQYNSHTYTKSDIPGDYRVLFVQCSNVVKNGQTYTIADNSTKDKVFDEAVINYEFSVESFAKNYNVP